MPRVTGLDAFAEAMSDCKESFALIGGTARSILFEEAESSFRATKDLDVVLLADGDSIAFGKSSGTSSSHGGTNAEGTKTENAPIIDSTFLKAALMSIICRDR